MIERRGVQSQLLDELGDPGAFTRALDATHELRDDDRRHDYLAEAERFLQLGLGAAG
jgi:hypothetical protein